MNEGKRKLLYLFFPDFFCLNFVEKQSEIGVPANKLDLSLMPENQHWKPEYLPTLFSSFQQILLEGGKFKRALCAI